MVASLLLRYSACNVCVCVVCVCVVCVCGVCARLCGKRWRWQHDCSSVIRVVWQPVRSHKGMVCALFHKSWLTRWC